MELDTYLESLEYCGVLNAHSVPVAREALVQMLEFQRTPTGQALFQGIEDSVTSLLMAGRIGHRSAGMRSFL
jgi:hypothetical protein